MSYPAIRSNHASFIVYLAPENHMALVEISRPVFGVDISIAYATAENFTGAPVYARAGCYLHTDAAAALTEAVRLAGAMGYRFRVFDAFRPTEAQWALWNHTPDPDFLADPRRGSPHSRGVAVDLTLIDETGTALDMGTAFDAFTPLSHHGNTEIGATAQRNRHLLMGIMTTAGWDFYRNEWWHYQLFNSRDYDLVGDAELPEPMMPASAINGETS
jgi:D-alanyl-D-alanine dipeptidase